MTRRIKKELLCLCMPPIYLDDIKLVEYFPSQGADPHALDCYGKIARDYVVEIASGESIISI